MAKGKLERVNQPNEFEKFDINKALDSIVTMAPNEMNPEHATVLTDAKGGIVQGVTQQPELLPEYVPPAPIKAAETIEGAYKVVRMSNPEEHAQNAYRSMLREEEVRLAQRNAGVPPVMPANQNVTQDGKKIQKVVAMEDSTLSAYRATLRQEEDRLRSMPQPPPLPPMPGLDSVIGVGHTYHGLKEPVFKKDADKLAVESYLLMRRCIAGQYINPYGDVYQEMLKLMERMKGELCEVAS